MASANPDIRRVQSEVCGLCQVRVLVKDLEDFCKSEDLYLEPLRTKISFIPPIAVRNSNSMMNVCSNSNATVEIVECLLEAYSQKELPRDEDGRVPLHRACANESIDPKIIQLLLDFWPDSVRQRSTSDVRLPMHCLCWNSRLNDASSLKVLSLLLEAYPEAVYEATHMDLIPIHIACQYKSWAFCKLLIDIYPESVTIVDLVGRFPIHRACKCLGSSETVKNLYVLFPEGANIPDGNREYPIHVVCGSRSRSDKVDIIAFLIAKDPSSARLVASGDLPLHVACKCKSEFYEEDSFNLDSTKLLLDAYPDAIEIEDRGGRSPVDLAIEMERTDLAAFLQAQYAYAVRARDERAMTTRDGYGRLPLHHALADGACLGATKLLVRGNPAALQVPDIGGSLPVHIACEFGSLAVAQFLIAQYDGCLSSCDSRNNYPLHLACRGGSYDTVNFLLAQQTAFVSKTNADGRLPIHLLLEPRFGATWVEVDQESQKLCLESIYRLLVAYPDTLTQTLR